MKKRPASAPTGKHPGKKARRAEVKDPQEAAEYLRCWSQRADGERVWRFNKSTQSWLLRHMYDKDRVSKEAFKLLLEYLTGLQGAARARTREAAEEVIRLDGQLPGGPEPASAEQGEIQGALAKVDARLCKTRLLRAKKCVAALDTGDA